MEKTQKMRMLSGDRADPVADLPLIHQYSKKELAPEDIYCFSMILCDNEVDRDLERFTDESLEKMAPLFVGKPGISDHSWEVDGQVARLYRVYVEETGELNSLGQPKKVLRGDAYMLKTEETRPIIESIEGGIRKEISVGLSAHRRCSICGEPYGSCEHLRGKSYQGVQCHVELVDPTDAYEWSFVVVPAQRGAGVVKSMDDVVKATDTILLADTLPEERIEALEKHLARLRQTEEERKRRREIEKENERYLRKE